MSSILKAINDSASTVLGTVSTTAHTVDKLVNTIGSGIDIASSFVQKQKKRQLKTHLNEMAHFTMTIDDMTAADIARDKKLIVDQMSQDTDLAKLFAEAQRDLKAYFDANKSE